MRKFLHTLLATQKRKTIVALILLAFLIIETLFAWLAIFVVVYPENSFDIGVSQSLHHLVTPAVTLLMVGVSFFGETLMATVLLVALTYWLFERYHWLGLVNGLTVSVLSGVYWLLKYLIGRVRPQLFLANGYHLPFDYSFPSAHVAFYTLFFGFLILLALTIPGLKTWLRNTIVLVSIILIGLIGFARVYLGVHWATDVVGGYLVGLGLLEIATLVYLGLLYFPIIKHLKKYRLHR